MRPESPAPGDPTRSSEDESGVPTYLRTSFLRRVAHEVRGPAGIVTGALDEIQGASNTGADASAFLAMARRGVARLLRLADVLSITAELETPEPTFEPAPIDVAACVRDVVERTTATFGRRAVAIQVDVAASPSILADPRTFALAVQEVAANAIRFARANVRVRVDETADRALVVVCDDGPGMDATRTFPRFGDRNVHGGLGLSMSLVVDTVVRQGGSVTFDASSLPPGRPGSVGLSVRIAVPKRDV